MLALGVLSVGSTVSNIVVESTLGSDVGQMRLLVLGRVHLVQLPFLLDQVVDEREPRRTRARGQLSEVIASMDERYRLLFNGDPSRNVRPIGSPATLERLRQSERTWSAEIKPAIARVLAGSSRSQMEDALDQAGRVIERELSSVKEAVELDEAGLTSRIEQAI